jgi:molybdenum cofactor cytidylyltransferase
MSRGIQNSGKLHHMSYATEAHVTNRSLSPAEDPVTAVVLAAGAGKRMGRPKLLLAYRGKPLLSWTLELVERLPLSRRLIVLGAQAPEILEEIFGLRPPALPAHDASRVTRHGFLWDVLINPGWEEGMGSSLRLAAERVEGGMLVFLGDMPEVPRGAALEVLRRAGDQPVAPSFQGRRGFPIYLPRELRPQLLALGGDIGARELVRESCQLIPWPDPGVVLDVDREEDLPCARPVRRGS